MMVVAASSFLGGVRKCPDVVFAIATGSDILQPVCFPVLLLNHLTKILGTIVDLARLVDADILGANRPAADRSRELGPAHLPVRAYLAADAASKGRSDRG